MKETPDFLHHCLSGWPPKGPNRFQLEGDRLTYMLSERGKDPSKWDHEIIPTPEQWSAFCSFCDELDVWSWTPDAGDQGVVDGLQWSFGLVLGELTVGSRGQMNGAPRELAQGVMRIHRALQAMVGWESET